MKYFIDDKIMSDQRSLCVSSVTQFISIIAVILSVVKTGRGVSIYNNTDKNNFICGDSVTLSCNIDPIPVFGMSWSLDGIRIAVCVSGSCTKDPASPLYINYVVGGGNKIYNLTIDAVTTVMDATIFSCNDLSSTQDTIQLNVAVPIVSGDVSITDTLSAMHGNISVTTECVFPHNKEDFDIEFLTSQNMLVGNHVDITEYFEEGSACSKSSGCDGKHVTIYIGFTERNDAVATTIYAKIVHSGVVINTVPTTNVYRIVPCNSSQSFCDHRKLCVNKCNNITDCNDGSDEQNCSHTNTTTVTTAPTTGITSTKTYQHTNGTTPKTTTDITMSSISNFLTTEIPTYVMQAPYIYLTVFGGLLIIVTSFFIIHVVYICVKKNKGHTS